MNKRVLSFMFIFILIFQQVALAEKQEWVDKTFDFTKVKRVYIYTPFVAEYLKNGIVENEILDTFKDRVKLPNAQVLDTGAVARLIEIDTGIDLLELNRTDPIEAGKIFFENTPKHVDLIIYSQVGKYGMGSTYRQSFTYNTTNYQNSYIYGPNGTSAVVQAPQTQTHTVPGGNIPLASASVRWDVIDTRTGKTIFSRIDDRDRSNGSKLENTTPNDLYKRITSSFFSDLNDKIRG
jgi:hypothetical protein